MRTRKGRASVLLLGAALLAASCATDPTGQTLTVTSPPAPQNEPSTVHVDRWYYTAVAHSQAAWFEVAWWSDVARWVDTLTAQQAAARAQRRAAARPAQSQRSPSPPVQGTGACGGVLPPCWVMVRESGGNPNAYNPTGCSGRGCRGKWQCDPRTCSGTGSEAEQDAEAAALWDGGRGCSHWAACG